MKLQRDFGMQRETRLLGAAAAQRLHGQASTSLRGADAAQIRGDVGLAVVDGKFECSPAITAVQGVSERRKRAGVHCTSSSRRRLRRAPRETGRFQRDRFQKTDEEGSFHYKNRRLKNRAKTQQESRVHFKQGLGEVAHVICRFDVCAALHEKPADFNVTISRRRMKRGPSTTRTGD